MTPHLVNHDLNAYLSAGVSSFRFCCALSTNKAPARNSILHIGVTKAGGAREKKKEKKSIYCSQRLAGGTI
jgi:hypothetical protein